MPIAEKASLFLDTLLSYRKYYFELGRNNMTENELECLKEVAAKTMETYLHDL